MKENFNDEPGEEGTEEPITQTIRQGTYKHNTVELSSKGFCQEMVQEMNLNNLKISKLKLENLIKEKEQLKQYGKENLLTKRKAVA